MASFKLTQSEVCAQCEQFLYIFASDAFCSALGGVASRIIKAKRANQRKILIQSAQANGSNFDTYADAIREAFISVYGMKPAEALVTLAKGGEVAGKNWSKGVYAVSGDKSTSFSQSSNVTVDPTTGKILVDGVEAKKQKRSIGGKSYPNNARAYTYKSGTCSYSSLYDGTTGKYYAYQFVDTASNTSQTASGETLPKADTADIWTNVESWIDKLIAWIISIFGDDSDNNSEKISSANTSPTQEDGFITNEAGIGTIGILLLASLAAGTLLSGKGKKKKESN